MTKIQTQYAREAKYGILAALDIAGDNEPLRSILNIALGDIKRALGEQE